jgi:hypothetical protein
MPATSVCSDQVQIPIGQSLHFIVLFSNSNLFFLYLAKRKTKIDNVTPAKAGVQNEKAGFPLPRE